MDTLDAELQRVLRNPTIDEPDVDDALMEIYDLHNGRTAMRGLAMVAAGVVVAGAAYLLSSSDSARSEPPPVDTPSVNLAGAVPWSDRQDYEKWTPPSLSAVTRPDAAPCRADSLELVGTQQEGATGHVGIWVRYTNTGDSRCTLKGYPRLTGREGPMTPEHDTFFPAPDASVKPATIDPGEIAVVVLETSPNCDPQTPVYVLTDARVVLDDSSSLPTRLDLSSSCPIQVDSWYRELSYLTEPPSRFDELRATIETPKSVVPGSVLTYVVTLRNSGPRVELQPCPGFRQYLSPLDPTTSAPGKPLAGDTWRLNCDTVGSLDTGESARFEMQLDVPAAYASSPEVYLRWGMVDNMPDYDAETWIPVAD